MRIVKEAFDYPVGLYSINVPANARTVDDPFDTMFAWVDPSTFPHDSFERHSATFRGIRVPLSNTVESHRND